MITFSRRSEVAPCESWKMSNFWSCVCFFVCHILWVCLSVKVEIWVFQSELSAGGAKQDDEKTSKCTRPNCIKTPRTHLLWSNLRYGISLELTTKMPGFNLAREQWCSKTNGILTRGGRSYDATSNKRLNFETNPEHKILMQYHSTILKTLWYSEACHMWKYN